MLMTLKGRIGNLSVILPTMLSVASLNSCGKLPGFRVNAKTDNFAQALVANNKIDMIFVVDNSGSMAEEQTILANSFSSFISQFTSRNLDFQLGIDTTDNYPKTGTTWWSAAGIGGRKPYLNFLNDGPGGLLAYMPTGGSANPKILLPNTPDIVNRFKENALLGINGDGSESGILTLTNALSSSRLGAGGWNHGLVRDGALLYMVVISDEDESYGYGSDVPSGESASNYVKRNTTYKNARVKAFTDLVMTVKPDQSLVRFDAIVTPTVTTGCQNVMGAGGAAVDLGVGDTYMEVAAKLNGKSASICRDFTDTIVNVGADLVKALTRFKLVQPPAAGEELEVSVNGRVIPQDATNGWTYLLDTQEIEFNGTEVPPTGARISITYVPSRPAA